MVGRPGSPRYGATSRHDAGGMSAHSQDFRIVTVEWGLIGYLGEAVGPVRPPAYYSADFTEGLRAFAEKEPPGGKSPRGQRRKITCVKSECGAGLVRVEGTTFFSVLGQLAEAAPALRAYVHAWARTMQATIAAEPARCEGGEDPFGGSGA